jgi:ParB-like chromosome segregation protein Spo0J
MKHYEQHEIGKCWPPLTPEEFSNLKAAIKNNPGEKPPVILYEGKILDGWHWYKGSQELKIATRFEEFQGDQDPTDFVANRHKGRRHLSMHDAAEVASKLAPLHRGSPSGNVNAQKDDGKTKASNNAFVLPAQPQPVTRTSHVNKTLDKVARSVGTSPSAIQNYRYIASHGVPEIAAAAKAGTIALSRAAQLAHLPREQQLAALNQRLESNRTPRAKKQRSSPKAPHRDWREMNLGPPPTLDRRCEVLWHSIIASHFGKFKTKEERKAAVTYLIRALSKMLELIDEVDTLEELYVRTH